MGSVYFQFPQNHSLHFNYEKRKKKKPQLICWRRTEGNTHSCFFYITFDIWRIKLGFAFVVN